MTMRRAHAVPMLLVVVTVWSAAACGGEPTPEEALVKSCNGDTLRYCQPYEYALVREGVVMPDGIEIADPTATVGVIVRFDRCAEASGPHTIRIQAIVEGPPDEPDGGATGGGGVYNVYELRDDGTTDGDAVAEDGEIDVVISSIFYPPVPPSTSLTLRFQPALDDCPGGTFESPYRTGPMWMP